MSANESITVTAGTAADTAQDNANATTVDVQTEGTRVHVGNLSYKATEEQVRDLLTPAGEVTSIILPMRFKNKHRGWCYANFKTKEGAQKAVETLNGTELEERPLVLELAHSKEENAARRAAKPKAKKEPKAPAEGTETKAAKGKAAKESKGTDAAASAGEGEGKATADKAAAPKKKASKVGNEVGAGADKQKKPRRRREDGEDTAVDEDGVKDGDEAVATGADASKKAAKKPQKRLALTNEQSKNTVFVANLPYKVDDAELSAIFTEAGFQTDSAHVINGYRRVKGRRPFVGSKGFGFVVLVNSEDQAPAVAKLNGKTVGDRQITAKIAQEMKPVEEIEAAKAVAGDDGANVKTEHDADANGNGSAQHADTDVKVKV